MTKQVNKSYTLSCFLKKVNSQINTTKIIYVSVVSFHREWMQLWDQLEVGKLRKWPKVMKI